MFNLTEENNTDKVTAYIKNGCRIYTEPSSTTVTPNDNLVITFDESWTTDGDDKDVYGDAGATVTIIDDPSNSNKGKVLNVQYNESANDWQNAQMILNAAKSQKHLILELLRLLHLMYGQVTTIQILTKVHTLDF